MAITTTYHTNKYHAEARASSVSGDAARAPACLVNEISCILRRAGVSRFQFMHSLDSFGSSVGPPRKISCHPNNVKEIESPHVLPVVERAVV